MPFSYNLLLVYRNATDFCMLIFYPAPLKYPFISSNSFLVMSLGFSIYSILPSGNSDSFTTPFPIWIFVFFVLSDCCGWIPNTVLNKSGDSGHPFLVFVLELNSEI